MNRVFLCSPFANFKLAVEYARLAAFDSMSRGEAPFVPHLLYPQLLPEDNNGREAGFRLSERWLHASSSLVAYVDFGISHGMKREMHTAERIGVPIIRRSILVGEVAKKDADEYLTITDEDDNTKTIRVPRSPEP